MQKSSFPRFFYLTLLSALFMGGCALNNTQKTKQLSSAFPSNLIRVSIHDQKMELIQNVGKNGESHRYYPVSTSKYGIGDEWNSYKTPIGRFVIAKKIGDGIPLGGKFYHRKFTGDVIKLTAYDPSNPAFDHDSILTRILWLRGLDSQNKNSFYRGIFIHGTNQEPLVGQPVSYGCIRMKNRDVLELYDMVGENTPVYIQKEPLKKPVPKEVLASFHFYNQPRIQSTASSSIQEQPSIKVVPAIAVASEPTSNTTISGSSPQKTVIQSNNVLVKQAPRTVAQPTNSKSHSQLASKRQATTTHSSKHPHSTKPLVHSKKKISAIKLASHSTKSSTVDPSSSKKKKPLE
ncbi:hypothetical protein A946_06580 [Methylacidiphilum kamchatkense Kam1]|uniref:L,D-TPase catalytic domain-containing protein n=1 Tax=Methylacidiphilum kamchatkense Kam1 TaxID=1202785 RepID=A0ABR4ZXU5_9BACT|nr:L,D-transpeptidase family protein [Methylacidiphilum kamchatkense]KIE58546.1 hypothetical protein A946_06580 [Methylacidiphilum kamchatkense Kam1]